MSIVAHYEIPQEMIDSTYLLAISTASNESISLFCAWLVSFIQIR